MNERQARTIETVEGVLKKTEGVFSAGASRFFTESDITCYVYTQLLSHDELMTTSDKDGHPHFLLHTEYPTPFKCGMAGSSFERKADSERYKRGHFDLVVLNPEFVDTHTFAQVKAQRYSDFKTVMQGLQQACSPVVLYGIEFMYSRDPLHWREATNRTNTVTRFEAKVRQDVAKLAESADEPNFMHKAVMVTFVKGTEDGIRKHLVDNCKAIRRAESRFCFAD